MKKKRENRKEKKERKSKEVNSKCAILNGIIKSRFKTDIKNLLIRDSLQIREEEKVNNKREKRINVSAVYKSVKWKRERTLVSKSLTPLNNRMKRNLLSGAFLQQVLPQMGRKFTWNSIKL